MATYSVRICWNCGDQDFAGGRYSREHVWEFDGGARIPASSSPLVVPEPWSVKAHVDPEEAFIAAASSCHMLFFLHFARKAGLAVESYRDNAEGVMERDEQGRMAITLIRLRPQVDYAGPAPGRAAESALHDRAHQTCFIAGSIRSRIEIHPPQAGQPGVNCPAPPAASTGSAGRPRPRR